MEEGYHMPQIEERIRLEAIRDCDARTPRAGGVHVYVYVCVV